MGFAICDYKRGGSQSFHGEGIVLLSVYCSHFVIANANFELAEQFETLHPRTLNEQMKI